MLNSRALHLIYYSLIVPYISYCVELWRSTFKTTINPIIKLQKRAIRIINNADYYAHTEILFSNSHVMKYNDLFYYKIMQIMFRAKSKMLPDSIQRFFPFFSQFRTVLIILGVFTIQKAKKGVIDFFFIFVWNVNTVYNIWCCHDWINYN